MERLEREAGERSKEGWGVLKERMDIQRASRCKLQERVAAEQAVEWALSPEACNQGAKVIAAGSREQQTKPQRSEE
jgi:hypothetical protein